MSRHLDELAIARHLAGDAGPLARRRLARHLADCAACRVRLAEIEAERRAWDAEPGREAEIRRLVAHAPQPRPQGSRAPRWLPAVALAGGLALGIGWLATRPPDVEPQHVLRAKGGEVFVMYLDREGAVGPLPAACAPGDRLRARLEGPGRHVFVIGIDGAGTVAPLLPGDERDGPRLGADPLWSPGSWVLDATPGTERFVAAFAERPLALDDVTDALAAQAADPLTPVPGIVLIEHRCTKRLP